MALLIAFVGGSIRINDAGESCPEWPTCFGTWHFVVSEEDQEAYWAENPDQEDSRGPDHRYTTFQIFVEWFHRLLVGLIAIPILANVIMARRLQATYGVPVSRAALFSAGLLFLQAAAGLVTVVFDNADWTVAMHLSLACLFTAGLGWQYMSMRLTEGASWAFMQAPSTFLNQHKKRIHGMTGAVGLLLILGAWVSSSAGGQYNQSCSVGFPTGWPQCQGSFLPSLEGPGIFIQMIHRFGALVVGLILILGLSHLRTTTEGHHGSLALLRSAEITTGLWVLNVMVGGSYIVFAKVGDFPEWLSLMHLVVGVSAFLSAVVVSFSTTFALRAAKDGRTSTSPASGEEQE
jgi:cytochrome c oxidase assembly protein subunit 15